MEQDRKHWPKHGPTGDPEEDARRKSALSNRLQRLIKDQKIGHNDDLFSGMGGVARPRESKRKFELNRQLVRRAGAFDLDIPPQLERYFYNYPMTELEEQEILTHY